MPKGKPSGFSGTSRSRRAACVKAKRPSAAQQKSTSSALSQEFKRRKSLAFKHFKKSAAACRDAAHVFFDAVLAIAVDAKRNVTQHHFNIVYNIKQ
jgi:hypothetical protein